MVAALLSSVLPYGFYGIDILSLASNSLPGPCMCAWEALPTDGMHVRTYVPSEGSLCPPVAWPLAAFKNDASKPSMHHAERVTPYARCLTS